MPQYEVSQKGREMLIVDGYKYTKRLGGSSDKIQWRCAFRENNRYVCTAKATTHKNDDKHIELRGVHLHPPNNVKPN